MLQRDQDSFSGGEMTQTSFFGDQSNNHQPSPKSNVQSDKPKKLDIKHLHHKPIIKIIQSDNSQDSQFQREQYICRELMMPHFDETHINSVSSIQSIVSQSVLIQNEESPVIQPKIDKIIRKDLVPKESPKQQQMSNLEVNVQYAQRKQKSEVIMTATAFLAETDTEGQKSIQAKNANYQAFSNSKKKNTHNNNNNQSKNSELDQEDDEDTNLDNMRVTFNLSQNPNQKNKLPNRAVNQANSILQQEEDREMDHEEKNSPSTAARNKKFPGMSQSNRISEEDDSHQNNHHNRPENNQFQISYMTETDKLRNDDSFQQLEFHNGGGGSGGGSLQLKKKVQNNPNPIDSPTTDQSQNLMEEKRGSLQKQHNIANNHNNYLEEPVPKVQNQKELKNVPIISPKLYDTSNSTSSIRTDKSKNESYQKSNFMQKENIIQENHQNHNQQHSQQPNHQLQDQKNFSLQDQIKPFFYEFDMYIQSATIIQQAFRGYLSRKFVMDYPQIKRSIIKIQELFWRFQTLKQQKLKETINDAELMGYELAKMVSNFETLEFRALGYFQDKKLENTFKNTRLRLLNLFNHFCEETTKLIPQSGQLTTEPFAEPFHQDHVQNFSISPSKIYAQRSLLYDQNQQNFKQSQSSQDQSTTNKATNNQKLSPLHKNEDKKSKSPDHFTATSGATSGSNNIRIQKNFFNQEVNNNQNSNENQVQIKNYNNALNIINNVNNDRQRNFGQIYSQVPTSHRIAQFNQMMEERYQNQIYFLKVKMRERSLQYQEQIFFIQQKYSQLKETHKATLGKFIKVMKNVNNSENQQDQKSKDPRTKEPLTSRNRGDQNNMFGQINEYLDSYKQPFIDETQNSIWRIDSNRYNFLNHESIKQNQRRSSSLNEGKNEIYCTPVNSEGQTTQARSNQIDYFVNKKNNNNNNQIKLNEFLSEENSLIFLEDVRVGKYQDQFEYPPYQSQMLSNKQDLQNQKPQFKGK